jgi:hypothetical protein
MQHPWLQPPTPTVASHVYASVWSQVRLWVWLCVQSSSTNCVYMYFVIPRYLAIRAAQAPCLAAPPTPTLHSHPPCTRTHRALAPTLHSHPPCTQTHPALAPTLHSHPPCVRSAASLHPRASPSRTSPPTLHPPYALPPCALTVPFPLRQPGGQRLPLRPSQHLAARDLHSTSAADTGVRRRGLRPVGRGAGGAYGAAHLQLLASSLSPPPPP